MERKTTRRSFLKATAALPAALALGPLIGSGAAKAHKPKIGVIGHLKGKDFPFHRIHVFVPGSPIQHCALGERYTITATIERAIDLSHPGDTIFVHRGIHVLDGGLVIPQGKDGLTITGFDLPHHRIHLNGEIVLQSNKVTVSCLKFKCADYSLGNTILSSEGEGEECLVTRCWFDGTPDWVVERVGTYDTGTRKVTAWDGVPMPIEWKDLREGDVYRVRVPNGQILDVGTSSEFRVALSDAYPLGEGWGADNIPWTGATTDLDLAPYLRG